MSGKRALIIAGGLVFGVIGALMVNWGNPPNMGICVACFLRDIAGAVGLHRAGVVQYLRPEIMGFVIGAFITSFAFREFRPRGGSSPVVRFFLGAFVMVGALVFLGCPVRMMLRRWLQPATESSGHGFPQRRQPARRVSIRPDATARPD